VIGFIALTFLSGVTAGPFGAAVGATAGAAGIVMAPIATVIGSLIGAGIIYLFAKLLGAKGTYTGMYYLMSIVAVPFAVLAIVAYVPFVGWLVAFLLGLYQLYLQVLAISTSQDMSMGRAFLAIVIPAIIIAAIIAVLIVVVGAAFLGTWMANTPQSGLFGLGA
jgi:hypothetical protein